MPFRPSPNDELTIGGDICRIAEYPAAPIVYDNFDHADFDGSFQLGRWNWGGNPNVAVAQSDGLLVIEVTSVPSGVTDFKLTMNQPSAVSIEIEAFIEARMMIASNHTGQYMNISFSFETSLDGELWWCQCGMASYPDSPKVFCDVTNYTRNHTPEFQPKINIQYDKWYVIRMEISPHDFEVRYYVDGRLIGKGVPSDADRLKRSTFVRNLGAYIEPNTSITGYIDYIRTMP